MNNINLMRNNSHYHGINVIKLKNTETEISRPKLLKWKLSGIQIFMNMRNKNDPNNSILIHVLLLSIFLLTQFIRL